MIVSFGSIALDMISKVDHLPTPGETVLGGPVVSLPGGKGANQAVAARRGGADVAMVGTIGRDMFADLAVAGLRADTVDVSAVGECDDATGTALIAVDRRGENQIVLSPGANTRSTAARIPDSLLGPETTLLLQMEISVEQSTEAARKCKERGGKVLLNLAPATSLPTTLAETLDLLVVNEVECLLAARGYGCQGDDALQAGKTLAEGLGVTVVLTLGGRGAVALAGRTGWRIDALPITPVDTVGAGDAFVGILAARLAEANWEAAAIPEALRWATVAGALACLKPGAQTGTPRAGEIQSRLADLAAARPIVP